MNIEGVFTSIFGMLHTVAETVRGLVDSVAPEYSTLILLAISGLGGYSLAKRYPSLSATMTIVVYSLIIFLIAKFV